MSKENSRTVLTFVLAFGVVAIIFGIAAMLDSQNKKEIIALEKEKLKLEIKLKRLELGCDYTKK